ncbi:murein biosynthesis integral membrane protein MurJ [Corynebacterium hadale]|uniref:murein biosynthesis integral membrane protein MurJ n=2 Tax=Corynebacterium hadale TaxID=2026255 RepID=UPI001EF3123F|nr:murein biosynthesis integral membrane protein MurJ [Corynebacterium hadale]MCG7256794.1 murein biosynthesis integral membrane protein MurJ [Corynebacterium hadale]MCG7265479.1 murein biosynthesis integral membrane protein MurJ [Corynebacterium hadale]
MTQQDDAERTAGLRRRIVTPAPPAPVPQPPAKVQGPEEDPNQPDKSMLTTSPKGESSESDAAQSAAPGGNAKDSKESKDAASTDTIHVVDIDDEDLDAPAGAVGAGAGAAAATATLEAPTKTDKDSDTSAADTGDGEEGTSNTSVVRATGSMAVATLISRVTGFIRTVLIGAALGPAVASAFNTANTLPNIITEIVLGSVLTALVVPVLVRAEKEDEDHGARFIRQLFTLTVTLMTVVTVLAVACAPLLTRLFLDDEGKVNVVQATSFAFLVLPQIFFYGLFSLFMAILNTKEHFRPGAWAPVANNVVSIAVLLLYMLLPGSLNPAAPASISNPHVALLGLGTTLGVVVQCLIMMPALRKLRIDLRPLWGIDDRLKQFGGMALAIITYVAISQAGYIVTTRIASTANEAAPIIYQQHWMLLQVPYGIIGVTLLTAIMPRLSRNAADGDDEAVVRDLTLGTKLTFIALIPIIVFMTALGPDIGHALFAYGNFDGDTARTLGLTISFSAFTLIPYALVMLHLRVFYAREEAWTPTMIIAGITATKIVLSYLAPMVADSTQSVVVLLGAANGFGFIAGALIGAFLLRRKLGTLEAATVMRTSLWAAGAGLVGIAVTFLLRWLVRDVAGINVPRALGSLIGLPSLGFLIEVAILGILFLIVTGLVLSRSKLPEVQNLGRALTRIPGLGRFIRPDDTAAIEVGEVDPRDVSTQFLVADTFNASPVPPPMSAGVVRGPRLVPGANVSDGRFRLIRDHGATTGARFWQARELSTGAPVALTFVDTTGAAPMAPVTPREAALQAAGVARRTRKLARLGHPAIADNIEILSYRSGALIVADWIEGSSVKAVAESGQTLHTEAVANALAPLAGALATAHEQGIPLGLDNRQRLRVDTDGHVRLAFPAVLPDASGPADAEAFASALQLLTTNVNSDALDGITQRTRALVDADAIENSDFHDLEDALRREANLPAPGEEPTSANRGGSTVVATAAASADEAESEATGAEDELVEPIAETTHDPDEVRGGFGSRRYGTITVTLLTAIAVGAVVLIAILTASLVGLFSGNDINSPVTQNSVEQGAENLEREAQEATGSAESVGLPVIIGPLKATAIGTAQDTAQGTDLSPVVDGDRATSATVTRGEGVKLAPPESAGAVNVEQMLIDTTSDGGPYEIYGVPADFPAEQEGALDVQSLPKLAEGKFHPGQNSVDVTDDVKLRGVILQLPAFEKSNSVEVKEVSVIGYTELR